MLKSTRFLYKQNSILDQVQDKYALEEAKTSERREKIKNETLVGMEVEKENPLKIERENIFPKLLFN